ncbi:MAG: phage tail protein [Bacteroidales bacterium]|nr:phage tail protein [Bacteroidales bacterium]
MVEYPLVKFHFQVEWGGTKMNFSEVTGMSFETEVIEYSGGQSSEYSSIKIPGKQKYQNITLKRGIFEKDNEFFQWWNTVQLGDVERRDVTISMLNSEHQPIISWQVKRSWPVKVDHGDLKAEGSEVAIETLELAHEGITVKHV